MIIITGRFSLMMKQLKRSDDSIKLERSKHQLSLCGFPLLQGVNSQPPDHSLGHFQRRERAGFASIHHHPGQINSMTFRPHHYRIGDVFSAGVWVWSWLKWR